MSRAISGVLLTTFVLAATAQAAPCTYFDAFVDNGNGSVTDPRSNLTWQRCAAGQAWVGKQCVGTGTMLSWEEAAKFASTNRLLGVSDWRLPTFEEIQAIVGKHEDCLVDEAKKPWRAVSRVFPPVRADGYVGAFWSSTPFGSSGVWLVYFFDGASYSVGRDSPVGNARLVRK